MRGHSFAATWHGTPQSRHTHIARARPGGRLKLHFGLAQLQVDPLSGVVVLAVELRHALEMLTAAGPAPAARQRSAKVP